MNSFSEKLLFWYNSSARDLPWRHTKNPYKIWLSEIILQQTRVQQGIPYYEKFIAKFPSVKSLATAKEQDILKIWQGLGYYSRARNLHCAAKQIINQYGQNGFPKNYDELILLKGIGKYTAAAISSIAFGEVRAAVDGNVYRVLSRFFGINTPIDTTVGVKKFEKLAQSLISQEQPGNYNQAVMELGALVCTPKKPKCDECVLNQNCFSFENKSPDSLPVKSKKIKKVNRFFYYFDIRVSTKYLIKKRENNKDIWCGLYELPLIETDKKINGLPRVLNIFCSKYSVEKNSIETNGKFFHLKHVLTHQTIHAFFIGFSLASLNQKLLEEYKVLGENSMKKYPFPRLLEKYFQKK